MESTNEFYSFWDHVSALRHTLGRMLLVITIGVFISFCFHQPIIRGLTSPVAQAYFQIRKADSPEKIETFRFLNTTTSSKIFTLPKEAIGTPLLSEGVSALKDGSYQVPSGSSLSYSLPQPSSTQLAILGPLDGVFIALKVSFWMGLVATSPLWLWIGLQFVLPALTGQEKRLILPFFLLSYTLVSIGILFTFYLTIPLSNSYLLAFNEAIGVNLWSLSHYLDYTLLLLLANGLAFELGAVGLICVHLGLIRAEWLSQKRRAAIVLAFIIGALLTPPDVLTQLMLAVPLIVFYEILIVYARLCRRH